MNLSIKNWIITHALLMLLLGVGCLSTIHIYYLLAAAGLSFIVLIFLGKNTFYSFQPFAGYANWITFSRLVLLLLVVGTVWRWSNIQLFVLFSLCLLMDGLDGLAARQYKQASDWGALFDKEVDSFFVLVVSILLYQKYQIPAWIILIGTLHYGYELVLFVLNWQHIETKKNPIGRYVAFLLFIGLLCPLIIPSSIAHSLLIGISLLVVVSFGVSFFFKFQQFQLQQ